MLQRIYVHNYRTFVHFEWRPPSACVLVGDHGSGKSALFDVLCMLQDVVARGKGIEESGFPATRTAWLDEPIQVIELELEHGGDHFKYRLEARLDSVDLHDRGRESIVERLSLDDKVLYESIGGAVAIYDEAPGSEPRTVVPFDRRRSLWADIEPGPGHQEIAAFRGAIAQMWMFKLDPLRIRRAAQEPLLWIDRDLGNFPSWFRTHMHINGLKPTKRLHEDLLRVIPGYALMTYESTSAGGIELQMKFDFGGKTHKIGWHELSEGQRLLVALYGVLRFAFEHDGLIVLDGVESYVAPAEIQPWLRAVADVAAGGNRQLIVISHHPESIDYLAADAAWKMSRDPTSGCSRIERLAPDREAGERAYDLAKQRDSDG